jgi:hypothetical protein
MALVVVAGTAAALALQYSRRRTTLARATLAGTLVLTTLVVTAPRWGGAFAIQRLFSSERISDAAVRISFDESRAGTRSEFFAGGVGEPPGVRLEIPVRVDDVPQGMAVGALWTSVSLKSARGTLHSGWLAFHALHDVTGGAAWLTVYVDPDFYKAYAEAAVQLDGTVDLALSRRVRSMPVEEDPTVVPEIGICMPSAYRCYSPFQRVFIGRAMGSPAFPQETSQDGPYAPFPTTPGFLPLEPTPSITWPSTVEYYGAISLVMHRPVAYVQLHFQVRGLRMSQFRVPQQ